LTSLLPRQSRHHTNRPRTTQDVPTGHRTILSLPVPILQTRRRPMRCTSTTRTRCPREDSSRRIRLRPTLEATSQTRSEIWTAITARLWVFKLEDLDRSMRMPGSTCRPYGRQKGTLAQSPADFDFIASRSDERRGCSASGESGLVRHEAHKDFRLRSFARSDKKERPSISGQSLSVASSRG